MARRGRRAERATDAFAAQRAREALQAAARRARCEAWLQTMKEAVAAARKRHAAACTPCAAWRRHTFKHSNSNSTQNTRACSNKTARISMAQSVTKLRPPCLCRRCRCAHRCQPHLQQERASLHRRPPLRRRREHHAWDRRRRAARRHHPLGSAAVLLRSPVAHVSQLHRRRTRSQRSDRPSVTTMKMATSAADASSGSSAAAIYSRTLDNCDIHLRFNKGDQLSWQATQSAFAGTCTLLASAIPWNPSTHITKGHPARARQPQRAQAAGATKKST